MKTRIPHFFSALLLFLFVLGSLARADQPVRTVLHSFQPNNYNGSADGYALYPPFVGQDGNLYGRTAGGGTHNHGTFYRLTLARGSHRALRLRPGRGTQREDLTQGADGNFYGVNSVGGSSKLGSIYQLTPAGQFTTFFDFGNATNGRGPGSILAAGDGNFYGVFNADPLATDGSTPDVYRLTPGGTLSTFYRAADHGGSPVSSLRLGSDGNFYGLPPISYGEDGASLTRITPDGTMTVLHHFDAVDDSGVNTEGSQPNGIVVGRDGNVYGTTRAGGANGTGTFYRITPDGTLTVLRALRPEPANPGDPQLPFLRRFHPGGGR